MAHDIAMTDADIIWPRPGSYVIAVSGGVDSVVLLHLMATRPDYRLIVATVDHGWRVDSGEDTALVERLATNYEAEFVVGRLLLSDTSEATARTWRRRFLMQIMADHKADGLVLGHHKDDIRETSLLNAVRGSDRAGLAPMQHQQAVVRPLAGVEKADLYIYAREQELEWREDSSNREVRYRRNYLREVALPGVGTDFRRAHDDAIQELTTLTPQIEAQIEAALVQAGVKLRASQGEVVVPLLWLRQRSLRLRCHIIAYLAAVVAPGVQLRREQIERLALAISNSVKHSHFHLGDALSATLEHDKLVVTRDQSGPVQ